MNSPSPQVLQADSVRKSFQGVQALRNASLELRPGEVHALVGENGAGKSTLIKVLTGALRPDAGVIRIHGSEVRDLDPRRAHELGIAAVYQQPAVFPDLTVAENIALSQERGSLWRLVSWSARRRKASEILRSIGADISPSTLARDLSMPEQQLVEIAKAIGAGAKIVIFDEPTASLTAEEANKLFEIIRRMRDEGVGLIYISHRLEEVAAIADRITVMRDGETIATRDASTLTRDELIELMIGRKLASTEERSRDIGDPVLELREVTQRSRRLSGISFTVHRGEILGIAGLAGAGRTELAETIFGLSPADSGEVLIQGTPMVIDSPARAIEWGLAYVPEDRRKHGVVLDLPIFANTSLACLKQVSRFGLIEHGRERQLAARFMSELGVKASTSDTPAGALSGGNQQKVALSRWLATEPKLLILDEPTQGVDIGSKAEIHRIIRELADVGLAVIVISSEMEELLSLSDRVMVMAGGRVRGVLGRSEATQASILALAMQSVAA